MVQIQMTEILQTQVTDSAGMPNILASLSQMLSPTRVILETCTIKSHDRKIKAHNVMSTFLTCVLAGSHLWYSRKQAACGLHCEHLSTRKLVWERVLPHLGDSWKDARAFCSLCCLVLQAMQDYVPADSWENGQTEALGPQHMAQKGYSMSICGRNDLLDNKNPLPTRLSCQSSAFECTDLKAVISFSFSFCWNP